MLLTFWWIYGMQKGLGSPRNLLTYEQNCCFLNVDKGIENRE